MRYGKIIEGTFLRRLNRFLAEVVIDGQVAPVHVKNTSRCRELFLEGVQVFLEVSDNPNRKTKYSIVGLMKGPHMYSIDSQAPNQVVYEALLEGKITEINDVTFAKREVTYGNSRFDIYYETATARGFIEVKGVTLEDDGLARFPDAPTVRGTKHVRELTKGLEEGYVNYAFFLLQMGYVDTFRPHHERDLAFADALYDGIDKGLKVLVYNAVVTRDGMDIGKRCTFLDKVY